MERQTYTARLTAANEIRRQQTSRVLEGVLAVSTPIIFTATCYLLSLAHLGGVW